MRKGGRGIQRTVSNDGLQRCQLALHLSKDATVEQSLERVEGAYSVDDQSQQGHLVGGSVVLQQSSGVEVTDGSVHGTLSDRAADGSGDSKTLEMHDGRGRSKIDE